MTTIPIVKNKIKQCGIVQAYFTITMTTQKSLIVGTLLDTPQLSIGIATGGYRD